MRGFIANGGDGKNSTIFRMTLSGSLTTLAPNVSPYPGSLVFADIRYPNPRPLSPGRLRLEPIFGWFPGFGRASPSHFRSIREPRSSRLVAGLRSLLVCSFAMLMASTPSRTFGQDQPASFGSAATGQNVIVAISGKAEFSAAGTTNWIPVTLNQTLAVGDRVRTGEKSRATIRLPNLTVFRINEGSTLEIRKPVQSKDKPSLDLKTGAAYFFGRGKPGEMDLRTPTVTAAIRGTEFNVAVAEDGQTTFTLIEGETDLVSAAETLSLKAGEQALVQPGTAPIKTPFVQAINVIQWALYYPGVLDVNELALEPDGKEALSESLQAYAQGDLNKAIAAYPSERVLQTGAGRIYAAALLLAAGQVDRAEAILSGLPENETKLVILSDALKRMVAAVKGLELANVPLPSGVESSSSWLLAQSYYLQAQLKLDEARSTARQATEIAPIFGFAWERLAELEFSFGRTDGAKAALDKSLAVSPLNAQAWALRGFILAAENQIARARETFDKAISMDSSLGNAWLGRGLCRIRQGEIERGREDLQTAAALEPNRSLLRSYLAKAFDARHDAANARREIEQARRLDPNDPTVWLYSALLNYEQHDVNRAIEDLERSLDLNDNRRVYRSGFLLDQDRAVRSASLANVYLAGGLSEVSVREASRAVAYDYSNYSAHRFLADSFNALRDPTRFNLRYETAWFNETLLADLLSPVGAGALSQHVSLYEYSKLFEADRLGLNSSSQVRSDGQFAQFASQYGTFGNASYALDVEYQNNRGVRPNNDLSRIEWYSKIKQQLTPQDTVFLLAKYQDFHSGDNFQYYNPDHSFRPNFYFDEIQSPHVVGAYHREWSPGMHTLFLAGSLDNQQRFGDSGVAVPLVDRNATGMVTRVLTPMFDVSYQSDLSLYTTELSQIFQWQHSTLVAGTRYQNGEFDTHNRLDIVPGSPFALVFPKPASESMLSEDFERTSGYAYFTQDFWNRLHLTGGLTYDWLIYPLNHRTVPLIGVESEREQWSPKVGLVLDASEVASVRAMYSRFLGGVSFDESYRLEPAQLAGFGQAYRSVISESVVGSVAGPRYEVAGAGLDLKLKSRTYAGVQAEWLQSKLDGDVGGFARPLPIITTGLQRKLDYTERSAAVYTRQLIGDHWSAGGSYTARDSSLRAWFPEIASTTAGGADVSARATLHQLNGHLLFNHLSGVFSRFDANWYSQSNRGYTPDIPGDEFPQLDIYVGYRFPRRLGSMTLGVLNLNDRDYRLNPLNVYSELPRERVFMARLRLQF